MKIFMYVQRHISDYLPFFIIFGSLLILLILIFFTPFVSHERKKFLRDSFVFCFVLCILTIIGDFFIFPALEMASIYTSYMGLSWSVVAVIGTYVWSIIAFSGLFMFLRAIPFCGKFLQWFTWLILTIPARLYFLVTNIPPTHIDFLNLLHVRTVTTVGTILPVLTPEIIFKACLPNIIIFIIMWILKLPQP